MSLANAFPEDLRALSVTRQIVPGSVIKFVARMDDGQEQEKRFVVLAVSDNTMTCVINSAINPYIAERPHLMQCQVKMSPEQNPFMDHESYIDCSRIRTYAFGSIQKQLITKPEWLLGEINNALRIQILAALKVSPNKPEPVSTCVLALTPA